MDGPLGQHIIADLYGVDEEHLKDVTLLTDCLLNAANRCLLTPIGQPVVHVFPGGGLTGFLLLSESHISLHTYPEHHFIGIDLFSCGKGDPMNAIDVFRSALSPNRENISVVARGNELNPDSV